MIQESRFKNKKGFTLIELILYMGIFSSLLMVLVQLFGSIVTVNLESEATSAVSQDGRYMLNEMTYTLRQAKTYTLPDVGTANAGSQLQFTTAGGTTYTYALSTAPAGQQNLLISDGSTTQQLNSYGTKVSNVNFIRLESTPSTGTPKGTITVSFTLTSTTRESKGSQQQTFQTTIGGRQ